MSMPGWYPDPAGNPGHYRYWNGSAWSDQTTTTPQSTPAPSGPGGPGSTPPTPGRHGRGPLVAAIACIVLLALAITWFLNRPRTTASAPEDTNTSTPTISAWNETSTPTPSTSKSSEPAPSQAVLTDCPDEGGSTVAVSGSDLRGGGLVADQIAGWDKNGFTMRWAYNTQSQTDEVYSGWMSVVSLSALSVADGFEQPKASAYGVMSCFASSSYYNGFTGRKDISSEEVTISGHKAWHLRSEVYVNLPDLPQVRGDVVDVVVVDIGDPESLGLWVSSYTIGDHSRGAKVEASLESLHAG